MTKIANFFAILLLALCIPAGAQGIHYSISPLNAEHVLKEAHLRQSVDFLTREENGGRAFGSEGGGQAAGWLADSFREMGLQPLGGTRLHSFFTAAGVGRNVIGFLSGTAWPTRYVVVLAHFDNIGFLGDAYYPGADSNASGVAALLELGRMFRQMQACKKTYGHGLILVALDGKEKDLAGAQALWNALSQGRLTDPVSGNPIYASQISLVVNLDQLGSTLAPLTKGNPNYLMMLSDDFPQGRSILESVNRVQHIGLELSFDYYGSKDFTKLFYRRISDQSVFLEHGIPAVMFTSGITYNNNKPEDNAASLDYGVLRKRVQLIFYWLDKVL